MSSTASVAAMAPNVSRWVSVSTSTQFGGQVSSSARWTGNPVTAPSRAAAVLLPEPVTP